MIDARSPDIVREHLRTIATQYSADVEVTPGLRGLVVNALNKALAHRAPDDVDPNECRHYVLGWLWGDLQKPPKPMSIKEVTNQQIKALASWEFDYDGFQYLPNPAFVTEACWMYTRAFHDFCIANGQLSMFQLAQNGTLQGVTVEAPSEGVPGMVDFAIQRGGVPVPERPLPEAEMQETKKEPPVLVAPSDFNNPFCDLD